MKCGYCGNGSGKTDMRGNCVSCGANLDKPEPVTGSWVERAPYVMDTDSSYMDLGKWESSLPSTISKKYEHYYLASMPAIEHAHVDNSFKSVEVPKTLLERIQDTLRNVWNG